MRPALPMACLLLLAAASLAGCSPPQPPDEERRPEPQAAPAPATPGTAENAPA